MTVPSATSRTNTSPRNDPNDTAINILEPYIGRISLEVYEDLHADLAGYIKDTRADEDAALSEERRRCRLETRREVRETLRQQGYTNLVALFLDLDELVAR